MEAKARAVQKANEEMQQLCAEQRKMIRRIEEETARVVRRRNFLALLKPLLEPEQE
jgi:hypothetical protein